MDLRRHRRRNGRAGTLGPRAGIGAATIGRITGVAEQLWFATDDDATGREPWTLDLPAAGLGFARRYGTGRAGAGAPPPWIA